MPWLPMYLDKKDIYTIIDFLNNDPEIAFIIQNGFNKRRKWIAVEKIDNYDIETYCLWHIPSGPLPLYAYGTNDVEYIIDPFTGWEEKKAGPARLPYFGAGGYVGVIWLNNRTNDLNKIGLSSFEWIGNYFKVIGRPAHQSTEIWWKNLRKMINKNSIKIGRNGDMKPEIYCLENALKNIENGFPRDINPF